MLVLSRKSGESIQIGPISVHILRVQGQRVGVGIEAPAAMPILRRGKVEFVREKKAAAAQDAAD